MSGHKGIITDEILYKEVFFFKYELKSEKKWHIWLLGRSWVAHFVSLLSTQSDLSTYHISDKD